MSVAQNSILRVIPTFSIGSQTKAQNVYHILHVTATPQSDTDVVDACLNWVEDAMDAIAAKINTGVDLDGIEVYERVSGAWAPVGEKVSSWAGTNANTRLPAGLAMLVEFYKERTGHADRKFICGMTDNDLSGEEWSAGAMTAAAAYVLEVIQAYTDPNGVELRGVHYRESDGFYTTYTGGAGVARIAYQRRRKPGVGLT
jgi:hypothetical protein